MGSLFINPLVQEEKILSLAHLKAYTNENTANKSSKSKTPQVTWKGIETNLMTISKKIKSLLKNQQTISVLSIFEKPQGSAQVINVIIWLEYFKYSGDLNNHHLGNPNIWRADLKVQYSDHTIFQCPYLEGKNIVDKLSTIQITIWITAFDYWTTVTIWIPDKSSIRMIVSCPVSKWCGIHMAWIWCSGVWYLNGYCIQIPTVFGFVWIFIFYQEKQQK